MGLLRLLGTGLTYGNKRKSKPARTGSSGALAQRILPMQHVLIIHEVADYLAWKKVFAVAAGIRKAAGEHFYQVLRYEHDANRIVHFSVWTSIPDARAFFESPKFVQIRKDAGVKAPDFIYLDQFAA